MKNHILSALAISWRLRRHFGLTLAALSFFLFTCGEVSAQAPQGIPYQAIARNASGQAIASTAVKVRFSIRDSIATGAIKYQETHNPTTSALGLFSVNVGMGTVVTGTFSSINWGKNAKFLQVEMDPAGGTTYTNLGTTQMMSVPFAMNAANGLIPGSTKGQMMYWNGSSWVTINIGLEGQTLTFCNGIPTWGNCYSPGLAIVTTSPVSSITNSTAICGGNVSSDGGSSIISRGVCWSTSQYPTIVLSTKTTNGSGLGIFSSSLTGLSPGTIYYVRSYATNSNGTEYGDQIVFATGGLTNTTATVTTSAIELSSCLEAKCGGNVTLDGGLVVTSRGVCWAVGASPTLSNSFTVDGSGGGSYNSILNGLLPNTTYFVRAYATNSAGTAYGIGYSFTTPPYGNGGNISDVDGNSYQTITYGSQVWMKENLKVARYRNGNLIPTGLTDSQWSNTSSGAYCFNNNDASNNGTYGKLYNWYAISDPRGLCPTGWHVPSDLEWYTLENYLDPTINNSAATGYRGTDIGKKMKSISSLWNSPNVSNNLSCFSGLPGGYQFSVGGLFKAPGDVGIWWSSTASSSTYSWFRVLDAAGILVDRNEADQNGGFSVRCIKD